MRRGIAGLLAIRWTFEKHRTDMALKGRNNSIEKALRL